MSGSPREDAPLPGSAVVTLWADAHALVFEHADGTRRWIGPSQPTPVPFEDDPSGLWPVEVGVVMRLVAGQLVRVADIARRARVKQGTVNSWRQRYPDQFPAPVVPGPPEGPGPLWWWPDLVAAGFHQPRRPGRPPSVTPNSQPETDHEREGPPR
jgi:hypothetical protein